MENLIFFLATSFVLRFSSTRHFRSYRIGTTGCSALLQPMQKAFNKARTVSGDELFTHQFSENGVSYGIICVQLKQPYTMDLASKMLATYIDKLKISFFILHNSGVRQTADWNNSSSCALDDYWQDGYGRDWKVKGYTNGNVLAVLYVKNISHVDVKKQDLFLDSFHFKPMR